MPRNPNLKRPRMEPKIYAECCERFAPGTRVLIGEGICIDYNLPLREEGTVVRIKEGDASPYPVELVTDHDRRIQCRFTEIALASKVARRKGAKHG